MLETQVAPAAQAVRLITDERSLREQYRFAFSNHYTVVQELMQNARRAGATRIDITYNHAKACLTVSDDGCGIDDFQILLTFAGSGWNDQVTQAERPYGFGFASALYVAREVEVASRGRLLAFDTTKALAGEVFSVTEGPVTVGTTITLHGVELKTPADTLAKIVAGFAIPVTFNDRELPRPDAIDCGTYEATPVGLVRTMDRFESSAAVVYLQGFQVYRSHSFYRRDVVHLDGANYRGKWPDRDRCLDEDQMVKEVLQAIRGLYEVRLARMKASLAPIVFCRQAYELARSLGRLDVFNDVDVAPGEWLGVLTDMPHSLTEGDELPLRRVDGEITRQSVETGDIRLSPIQSFEGFTALEYASGDLEPGADQLRWVHAYACGAHVLVEPLHHDHWLLSAVAATYADAPKLSYTTLHEARIGSERTQWIGHTRLLLTTVPTLEANGVIATTQYAFAAVIDDETTIVVPCVAGPEGDWVAAHVHHACLRQCYSYMGDDDCLDESDLDTDEAEANQLVRLLLARSPEEHLQSVLSTALLAYGPELKRYSRVSISFDQDGHVKVLDLAEATAA